MIIDGSYFDKDILEVLHDQRFISIQRGSINIELTLEKDLTDEQFIDYTLLLVNTYIDTIDTLIKVLNHISNNIHSYLYIDLGYNKLNIIENKTLQKGLINKIKPTQMLVNLLQNINIDTTDINVNSKFSNPNQLRFTSPFLIFYYFKKYLNITKYNSELNTLESPIITFNDKYIIDGRFQYFKHFLNDPNKPVVITNIFYTLDENNILNLINQNNYISENDQINYDIFYNEKIVSEDYDDNLFYTNHLIKFIDKQVFNDNLIKMRLHKLMKLHFSQDINILKYIDKQIELLQNI